MAGSSNTPAHTEQESAATGQAQSGPFTVTQPDGSTPPTARVTSGQAAPEGSPQVGGGFSAWWARGLLVAGIMLCLLVMFGPFTRESVGGAAIVLMLLLIFAKVPIGIALSGPGLLGLYALYGFRAAETLLSRLPYETVSRWELSVIPMFVFMGLLLWKSGITEKLYTAARNVLGWLPGGLAIGTNGAGAGLAAVSGSTIGSVHALARIGIPEMLRAGYDRRLAVGAVIVAGLPGQVIPPSIFLVIYAGLAQVPVGPQLIAGILPGLLLAACFAATVLVLCTSRPQLAGGRRGRLHDALQPQNLRSVLAIWPVVALIAVVLGGMYSGIVTVTEAGAAGAFGAVLLTLWYRRRQRPLAAVGSAAVETLKSMGNIFFLFVGAMALSRLLSVSGIGPGFSRWVTSIGLGSISFLLIIMVAYLIMGMFMDPLSIMLLTVPLMIPILDQLAISPLWFGVFVVILAETAIVTPPVGVLAYIVHGITKEAAVNLGHPITLGHIFRGIGWFLPATFTVCFLLILIPQIATLLPGGM